MLRYESIKQIKILVSKNLYHVLLSLAFIIVFEELFTATFGIRVKESDFLPILYSLGKTLLTWQKPYSCRLRKCPYLNS